MATSNYNLDINKQAIIKPVVILRQGDYGIDTMRVSLSVANEPMDLTGATVKFMGTTAGGRQIIDDVHVKIIDAKGGVFEYVFPSQAAGDIGEYKVAYFLITQANGQSSTMDFRVQVLSGVDISAPVASEYISHYETMVTELNSAYDSATSAANEKVASTVSSLATSAATVLDSALTRVNDINSTANNASSAASNAISMASSVASTVTSQASYINSVASSAASNVSLVAAGVINKLNNIQVGGRNLLLGTNDWSGGFLRWDMRGTLTNETYRGNVIAATSSMWTSPVYHTQYTGVMQVGKTYTFSTYVRNTSDTDITLFAFYDNKIVTNDGYNMQLPAHTDWTRVSTTFKVIADPVTSPSGLRWESMNDVTNGQIQFAGYKLEESNVPTDWTSAPEDVLNNELVTPYKYGAIGDGKADDTQAIQNMLDDWRNRSVILSGDFRITSPLQINNYVQIELTGKLIVDASMDYAIVVKASAGISGGGVGEIDLNNLSGGILVTNNAVFTPVGFSIKDIASNKIGISVDKKTTDGDTYGYVHMHDITMHNTSYQDKSIGVYGGRDSFYNNLETINLEIGMKLYGWDNYINGFHPWNDIPEIVKKGVGLYLESTANDTHVNNYYNDTMKYGFVLDADVSLTVTNMLSMWNTEFFNDSVNPGHPFVIYYSNDKISKPGRLVYISNSKFNQDPSQNGNGNLIPILSSISDNIISVSGDISQSRWWNLPMQVRPLVDGDDVNKYSEAGSHTVNGANNLVNYPSGASTWATLEVEKINQNTSTQTLTDTNNKVFIRTLGGNPPTWSSWTELANNSNVLHNTGNETVAGDKTFIGNVKFSGSFDSTTVNNNGVTMTFTRFGNIVTVIGSGTYTGGDVNTFSKISDGVVPSGYRPSGMALVNANWGPNIGQMAFESNGAWLHRGASSLSNSWVVITGSWSI